MKNNKIKESIIKGGNIKNILNSSDSELYNSIVEDNTVDNEVLDALTYYCNKDVMVRVYNTLRNKNPKLLNDKKLLRFKIMIVTKTHNSMFMHNSDYTEENFKYIFINIFGKFDICKLLFFGYRSFLSQCILNKTNLLNTYNTLQGLKILKDEANRKEPRIIEYPTDNNNISQACYIWKKFCSSSNMKLVR